MNAPEPPHSVELICAECGERIAVADVVELIRALHLKNECEAVSSLLSAQD